MRREKSQPHNIGILCDFFTSFVFLPHMSEYNEYTTTQFNTKHYEKLNLSQLYQELNNALHSKNVQSIWELSKAITRLHFRESGL
jgi:hypothetical protein